MTRPFRRASPPQIVPGEACVVDHEERVTLGLVFLGDISAGGPVVRPANLPRALATAVEAVAAGEPYLLDVVTELL